MNTDKKQFGLLPTIFFAIAFASLAQSTKPLYENNFEKAALDKVPEEFMVLDGGFAVKEDGGNKFLELPGAPLDTFGLLFGSATNANVSVSARIYGTAKGRRGPSFGVGLNGVGGYKLKISPAKNALEIYKGDDVVSSVPFKWEPASWTMLHLQVHQLSDTAWKIEGKAWPQKSAEPKDCMISFDEKNKPADGRASIWGSPYSGTPIRFDDLLVAPASQK